MGEENVNGIGRSEERRRDQRGEPEAIMRVAELVTAVSTEIGMGFVPISICWHAMNSNHSRCRT